MTWSVRSALTNRLVCFSVGFPLRATDHTEVFFANGIQPRRGGRVLMTGDAGSLQPAKQQNTA